MVSGSPLPISFPTAREERFLRLLLCPPEEFPDRWRDWRDEVAFDDVDFATLCLLPLLHLRLSELGLEDDEVRGRLRGVYRIAWVKNQRLVEDVRWLGAECERIGVPLLLLKGIALLASAHDRVGARMAADADVLVQPEHFEAVRELLLRAGWTAKLDNRMSAPVAVRYLRDLHHAINFRSPRGSVVDLHWRVYIPHPGWDVREALGLLLLRRPTLPPDLNDWHWGRSVEIRLAGQAFRRLSPEDMLVHLVVHGTRWNPTRPFRWVLDVVQLIRSSRIDWSQVPGSAVAAQRSHAVRVAMRYLSSRGFVELPDTFTTWVNEVPSDVPDVRFFARVANFPSGPTALRGPALAWYRYWRYQSSGSLLRNWIGLPAFLRENWQVDSNWDLVRLAAAKARGRLRERDRARAWHQDSTRSQ